MKLLLAATCQLVLNDPDYSHSLIGVFHEIRFGIAASEDPPVNALIPREWAVFSKWELAPEEVVGDPVQVCEVYWPDGSVLNRNSLASAKPIQSTTAFMLRNHAFPIGQSGKLRIVLWIEDGGAIISAKEEVFVDVRVDKIVAPSAEPVTT